MSSTRTVAPSVVRAFAIQHGLLTSATRGRLSDEVVAAFNKAHSRNRLKYVPGRPPLTRVKVTALATGADGRKRPVTRSVAPSEVRAEALRRGYSVGVRGRVPRAMVSAYVTGDWSSV